jgi:selenocysteine lyase/cysteine desulfurase
MLSDGSRQADFPGLASMVYLNTAAEGIPPRTVRTALEEYYADKLLGMDGRNAHFSKWEAAKEEVAKIYGLTPDEVSLCSCSSEAFNLAANALRLRDGDEVVINDLDFPAGITPWLHPGCPADVKVWRAREGALRIEDLIPLLGPKTRLLAVSLVSFYNGFMLPLPEVIHLLHKKSPAFLSLDVTQALGRISLDLKGVDLIISSTHKWILASHGGGLVGVPSERSKDLTVHAGGWFNLEDPFGAKRFEQVVNKPGAAGFTVGMPNFPAVYAIHGALCYIRKIGVKKIDKHARPLVVACLRGLKKLPIKLLTPDEPDSIAGILAFQHPDSERIHRFLHKQNIHIMAHAGRLRVSIHGYNTMADVECFLTELERALKNG